MNTLVTPNVLKPSKYVSPGKEYGAVIGTMTIEGLCKKRGQARKVAKAKNINVPGRLCQLVDGELAIRCSSVQSAIRLMQSEVDFGDRVPDKDNDESFGSNHDSSWTTCATFKQFEKQAVENPQSFRKFKESDIKLTDWESIGNDIEYETTGDFVDVGRYLEGQPECFGQMRDGQVQNKFCTIILNCCASWNVRDTTIAKRSGRVLRIVDALEANKVRCQIVAVFSSGEVHAEVVVKQFYDPLELNQLAVATSGDFFRWCIFRATEHSRLKSGCYGTSARIDVSLFTEQDDPEAIIYVDRLVGNDVKAIDNEFDALEKRIKSEGLLDGNVYQLLW